MTGLLVIGLQPSSQGSSGATPAAATYELMNALPKVLLSGTLTHVEWSNARVSDRPAEQEIPELNSVFVSRTRLGDAGAYCLVGCLDAVVEMELDEDAGDVVVDGVGAERELPCDVAVAFAAGEPSEDVQFALSEVGADRAGGVLAGGGNDDGAVVFPDAL